jgi:hypothetical protein
MASSARPVHEADNVTAICEPIILTTWDPQHLTILEVSAACYGNGFTFIYKLCSYLARNAPKGLHGLLRR